MNWTQTGPIPLHTGRKCPEKSFMVVVVVVVYTNYRVSSRSRPKFEIEMEFHMTLETSGVDLDRVWTGA